MMWTARALVGSVFVFVLTTDICSSPAQAQQSSLVQKLTGTWTLRAGWEEFESGEKQNPWMTGSTSFDSNGHFAVFLIGKDRPKASGDIRSPIGPFVAYYGTYTVRNESEGVIQYNIDYGSTTILDGTQGRQWTITFDGEVMRTTGKPIHTPQGTFTPVNEWTRAK
jgi:hypothetical protein